jgi:cytochrome b involved in lipid metabolism
MLSFVSFVLLATTVNSYPQAGTTATFNIDQVGAQGLTVINGVVYDLHSFMNKHNEGGTQKIKNMFGIDATSYLNTAPHKARYLGSVSKNIVGMFVDTPVDPNAAANAVAFTMDQIAAQGLTLINGNVYDLNAYAANHPPGPNQIKNMIGIDATSYLSTAPHGAGVLGVVSTFKKGVLGDPAATNNAGMVDAQPVNNTVNVVDMNANTANANTANTANANTGNANANTANAGNPNTGNANANTANVNMGNANTAANGNAAANTGTILS